MNLQKKEDAVSPVIGVMLMLVVTLVIAAVIATFAGGFGSDMEGASNVVISVDSITSSSGALNSITFMHKGGDSLYLSDLTLVISCNGDSYSIRGIDSATVLGELDWDNQQVSYRTWSPAQKCVFDISEVNQLQSNVSTFTWTITDASGQAIAKGTAEA